jgi:hypothetical protein
MVTVGTTNQANTIPKNTNNQAIHPLESRKVLLPDAVEVELGLLAESWAAALASIFAASPSIYNPLDTTSANA